MQEVRHRAHLLQRAVDCCAGLRSRLILQGHRISLPDAVYHHFRRRQLLAEVCDRLDLAHVQFSAGVVGPGTALYVAALAQGHEGLMAKHLASTYRSGRRSPAWRKIKPRRRDHGEAK